MYEQTILIVLAYAYGMPFKYSFFRQHAFFNLQTYCKALVNLETGLVFSKIFIPAEVLKAFSLQYKPNCYIIKICQKKKKPQKAKFQSVTIGIVTKQHCFSNVTMSPVGPQSPFSRTLCVIMALLAIKGTEDLFCGGTLVTVSEVVSFALYKEEHAKVTCERSDSLPTGPSLKAFTFF